MATTEEGNTDTISLLQPSLKRFSSIIPYTNGHLPQTYYENTYSFWKKNYNDYKDFDSKHHSHKLNDIRFVLLIGLLSTFAFTMQLLYIIDGPHPYRWISLSFLTLTSLIHLFYFILAIVHWVDDDKYNDNSTIYSKCRDVCSIFILLLCHVYKSTSTLDDSYLFMQVREKYRACLISNVFAVYPHIIILTIQMLFGDHLSIIAQVSYVASCLSICSFYVVVCTIFLHHLTFVLNVCWCLLDFCLTLFVLSSLLYDHVVTIVIVADLCIFCVAYIVSCVIIGYMAYLPYPREWCSCQTTFIFDTMVYVYNALFLLPMMYTINGFLLAMLDQYYHWNILPFCTPNILNGKAWHMYWLRYLLYEWIQNAPTQRESAHRLCCTNLVIMDHDSFEHQPKYLELQQKLKLTFDEYLVDFDCEPDAFPSNYNLKIRPNDDNKLIRVFSYGSVSIKFVHCILSAFVILYIGFNEGFNFRSINAFTNTLFYLILAFFVVCICLVCACNKSLYYHRRILDSAVPINNLRNDIAFCDSTLRTMNVLSDIFGDHVGYIIFHFIKNRRKLDSTVDGKYKILILGAAESGKSTLLRQLRKLYGRPYEENELCDVKPHLTQNLIEAMRTLAIYSDILADQGKNTDVLAQNREARDRVARMSDKEKYTKSHYEDFERLWSDPHIQNVLQYKHSFHLADSVLYLINKMDNYWRDDYVPTFEDVLYCRRRTTGVNKIKITLECEFELVYPGHEVWEIFDVGGTRNERRKWIHFFDNTACVFFCAALSGYNESLWENNSRNKLKEGICLFRDLVNLNAFKDTTFIVLLTKYDQFREKIGKHSFKKRFRGFNGHESESEVIEYVKQQFIQQIQPDENGETRRIYFHIGSVIDTSWVRVTFDSCRQIISSV
eukprot:399253_1